MTTAGSTGSGWLRGPTEIQFSSGELLRSNIPWSEFSTFGTVNSIKSWSISSTVRKTGLRIWNFRLRRRLVSSRPSIRIGCWVSLPCYSSDTSVVWACGRSVLSGGGNARDGGVRVAGWMSSSTNIGEGGISPIPWSRSVSLAWLTLLGAIRADFPKNAKYTQRRTKKLVTLSATLILAYKRSRNSKGLSCLWVRVCGSLERVFSFIALSARRPYGYSG